MSPALATYISIIALALSAVAWGISAFVSPVIEKSYWDALPLPLIRRQKIAAWSNMAAALLAAIGIAAQAYAAAAS